MTTRYRTLITAVTSAPMDAIIGMLLGQDAHAKDSIGRGDPSISSPWRAPSWVVPLATYLLGT